MKLYLKRFAFNDEYTIGRLYIDGAHFCHTLEPKERDLSIESKVMGKTAIPKGTYRIELRHSPRFGRLLPRLINVPFFEGVLIHRGNTAKDTEGCILVGENTKPAQVLNSAHYEKKLVELTQKATDTVTITIE